MPKDKAFHFNSPKLMSFFLEKINSILE